MKICFYNIFGDLRTAEQETLMRFKYCFEKQGHIFYITDINGLVIFGSEIGKHIEDCDIDFIFTYNLFSENFSVIPDKFSVFLHWAPIGFLPSFQTTLLMKNVNQYDYYGCTSEPNIFEDFLRINAGNVTHVYPSISNDFILHPQKGVKKSLFYVGINLERASTYMRYGKLIRILDDGKKVNIYGPKEAFGVKNLWAGFSCYCGEIPFDGKSILTEINKSGVCLALNSPMHNDVGAVTNRLYEGCAAGALVISDNNEFLQEIFGDSIFYIDANENEEKNSQQILDILQWIDDNPDKAYDMACRSQNIFLEKLTLDKVIEEFCENVTQGISKIKDISTQEKIDVICYVDEKDDFYHIQSELEDQYHQNFHLIIVTDNIVYSEIKNSVHYDHIFVEKNNDFRGKSFYDCSCHMLGKYFMFMDKFSIMHKRHISKNIDVLSTGKELFSYSGTYIKNEENASARYTILNEKEIWQDEFLAFKNISSFDSEIQNKQVFFIETIFSTCCAVFNKEILNNVDYREIEQISHAVHYYLACCSLIKKKMLGRFTYSLTSGYMGESLDDINERVFHHRKHWYRNMRTAKTIIKELNLVFFKYTYETTPGFRLNRNLSKFSVGIFNSDFTKREERILDYLKTHRLAWKVLNCISFRTKKKIQDRNMRFVDFFRRHHLIRNIYGYLAKRANKNN